MKRTIFVLLFSFLTTISFSQTVYKWRVYLKDKNGSAYSVSNPTQYLSQRSIDRREKQGISIDNTDLPVNSVYVSQILSTGVTYICKSKWLNTVVVEGDSTQMLAIKNKSFVSSVKMVYNPNPGRFTENRKFEEESNYTSTETDYGVANYQIEMLNGKFLHNAGYKGEGMLIAVMDAGFPEVNTQAAFKHLWDNNRVVAYWDFVDRDNSIFEGSSHGLNVASTMAAKSGDLFTGTAPEASYMFFRTEDAPTENLVEEDYWVAAAEMADSIGADIFNTSLGYTTFDDTLMNFKYSDMDGNTTFITRGADMAAKKGIIAVNSAGNSGSSPWYYIGAPADGDSVFAIGAVGIDETAAPFTSKGPTYSGKQKPNVSALGWGSAILVNGGGAVYGNGTSFSSPIMAGMVACFWQAFPELNNYEVMRAVESCSHLYPNPDYNVGYGIPDFSKCFLEQWQIKIKNEEDQIVRYFPNPFSDNLSLIYYSTEEEQIYVDLMDVTNKVIVTQNKGVGKDSYNFISFNNLANLEDGIYFLRVRTSKSKFVKKVVKMVE